MSLISSLKNLINNSGFKRYFRNTSWMFAEKLFKLVVGFGVGILVIRYLGPEKFGVLSYAQAFVGIFGAIATLGIDSVAVREFLRNEGKSGVLLGTTLAIRLFGAFVLIVCLGLLVPQISSDCLTQKMILIIASASFFQSFIVIDLFFQSQVLGRLSAIANLVGFFLSSLFKLALINFKASVEAFAFALIFESLAVGAVLVYFLLKKTKLRLHSLSLNWCLARSILKDSWPIVFSGMVISIYMKIDQIMIKEMLNSEILGQYAAAVRLSEAWYLIPGVVTASFFPAIMNAKKVSLDLYMSRLQKLYDLHFLIALLIGVPVIFFSEEVCYFLFGKGFELSGKILQIHMFGGFLVFMGVVRWTWMVAENLQFFDFFIHLTGAVSNVFFNWIFIKEFGVVGAAYGTLAAYTFSLFFSALVIKPIRPSFVMIMKGYWNVLSLKVFRKGYFYA